MAQQNQNVPSHQLSTVSAVMRIWHTLQGGQQVILLGSHITRETLHIQPKMSFPLECCTHPSNHSPDHLPSYHPACPLTHQPAPLHAQQLSQRPTNRCSYPPTHPPIHMHPHLRFSAPTAMCSIIRLLLIDWSMSLRSLLASTSALPVAARFSSVLSN